MPTTYPELTVGTATVITLIVNDSGSCTPTSSTAGTFGQFIICENYIYVYDGVQWKRSEASPYF
jgi:hypothetical protein